MLQLELLDDQQGKTTICSIPSFFPDMNSPSVRRSRLAPDQNLPAFSNDQRTGQSSFTSSSEDCLAKADIKLDASPDLGGMRVSSSDFISEQKPQQVVVSDIHMSFRSMVVFLVKASFAAIPAILIIALSWAFIFGFISGFFKYR